MLTKILFFSMALLFLANCSEQSSTQKAGTFSKYNLPTPNLAVAESSPIKFNEIPGESNNVDKIKRVNLEAQNQKLKQIPHEFQNVDFKNFKYPVVHLRNGIFEREEKPSGGTNYRFDNAFYLDLGGNSKKEAVIFLGIVSCGVSCDGGSSLIYFYSSQNGKAKFIDRIELGSLASGCSLKSFAIKDKKITVEQFGKCAKADGEEEISLSSCKFCIKDLTRSTYFVANSKLIEESRTMIDEPERNVMNYSAEINISE